MADCDVCSTKVCKVCSNNRLLAPYCICPLLT